MDKAREALKTALEHAGLTMAPSPKGSLAVPSAKMPQGVLAHAAGILPISSAEPRSAQKALLESLLNGPFLDSLSAPALECAFLMLMDPAIQSKIDPELRARPGSLSFSFSIDGLFDPRHHHEVRDRLFAKACELTQGFRSLPYAKKQALCAKYLCELKRGAPNSVLFQLLVGHDAGFEEACFTSKNCKKIFDGCAVPPLRLAVQYLRHNGNLTGVAGKITSQDFTGLYKNNFPLFLEDCLACLSMPAGSDPKSAEKAKARLLPEIIPALLCFSRNPAVSHAADLLKCLDAAASGYDPSDPAHAARTKFINSIGSYIVQNHAYVGAAQDLLTLYKASMDHADLSCKEQKTFQKNIFKCLKQTAAVFQGQLACRLPAIEGLYLDIAGAWADRIGIAPFFGVDPSDPLAKAKLSKIVARLPYPSLAGFFASKIEKGELCAQLAKISPNPEHGAALAQAPASAPARSKRLRCL